MSNSEKEDEKKQNVMEGMLEKLLNYRENQDIKDRDMLIMLCLLNLLGIINMLNLREEKGRAGSEQPGTGQMPFNPALLMNLLGGAQGGGQQGQPGFDIGSLMGLLGNLMGGFPGSTPPSQPSPGSTQKEPSREKQHSRPGNAASKMKVEKNAYRPEKKTGQESRPGTGNKNTRPEGEGPGNRPKKNKDGVLQWDFDRKNA